MLKKILVGTLLVGFVGVLIAGAVNRTSARLEAGGGRGSGSSDRNGVETGQGRAPDGRRGSGVDTPGVGRGSGRALARPSQVAVENPSRDRSGSGRAEVGEWWTLEGTVLRSDADTLLVGLTDGEEMVLDGRAWRFVQENGLGLHVGDSLLLTGFYEGDAFEVAVVENLANGQSLALREESGRPLWSQGGYRGGAG